MARMAQSKHRTHTPPRSNLSAWAARVVLVILPIVIATLWSGHQLEKNRELSFPMDDPYIHFQYAKNLASGLGFSFNPGEPSPGATSPLWVVVLAFGRVFGMPLESGSLVLGVLFTSVAAVLTFEVGVASGLGAGLAFIAGVAFAACGRITWGSLSGMEIALATALSLVVVRVMQSKLAGAKRAVWIGALAGLSATARPEMILIGPLVLGLEGWRIARREGPAGAFRDLAILAGAFAVMLAPYTLFCLATTGRPLPNTYYAKSWLRSITDTLIGTMRARYLPLMHNVALHDNLTFAVLLVPGVIVWAMRHLKRGSGLVLLWPLAFMAYSLVFYPRHFSLSRYTIPLVPFMALLSMAPLAWAMTLLRAPAQRAAAIAVVLGVVGFGAWRSSYDYEPIYLANCDNIVHQHVAMGRWVAKNLPPDARVASNDVGAITWFGGRYCIDVVGLVSSDFITHMQKWWKLHHTALSEEALPSFLRVTKPDFCILFPAWYPNLTKEPWLTPLGQFQYPNNTGGGNELVVYQVSGVPVSSIERKAGER